MSENRIFINDARPVVFWNEWSPPHRAWLAACPCTLLHIARCATWREAYNLLKAHVQTRHL